MKYLLTILLIICLTVSGFSQIDVDITPLHTAHDMVFQYCRIGIIGEKSSLIDIVGSVIISTNFM